jgi:hypothetical protein
MMKKTTGRLKEATTKRQCTPKNNEELPKETRTTEKLTGKSTENWQEVSKFSAMTRKDSKQLKNIYSLKKNNFLKKKNKK